MSSKTIESFIMRLFFFFLLFPFCVSAQPLELVITPTRSETPLEQVGSSVTVITADEIQKQQKQSVSDLLQEVPGIDVTRAGGVGQTTTVFMRGSPSEHTLVLIDGVEVNDPSSTAGSYGFETLNTDSIERIEVLRGNQSTLYGSKAIGGVINIITRHGSGAPSAFVITEAGSYNTYKAASGISGKVNDVAFNAAVSRFTTGGFSAFNERRGAGESDSSDYANFTGRVEGKLNDYFSAYSSLRYNNARAEFDNYNADGGDGTHAKELTMRHAVKASLWDGKWDQELGIGYYKVDRDTTTTGIYGSYNFFRGDRVELDWVHHIKANESNLLTVGAESKYETSRTSDSANRDSQRINGYFVQDQIALFKGMYVTAGGRVDDNTLFGSKTTWRIAPVYTVEATATRLKASYGTGFKAPSLFQLFSSYGNPDLKAEESSGFDFGFEQPLWNNRVQFGSTFFQTSIRNLIDYDYGTNKYLNVNSSHIRGLENTLSYAPMPDLQLKLQYTYMDVYDTSSFQAQLRRARHKASFQADYSFLEKGRAGVNAVYNGVRDDIGFNFERTTLPSNVVVNLTSSWQLQENLQLFGRVDNVLNKKYENLYGYGTAGLSVYGGVKITY